MKGWAAAGLVLAVLAAAGAAAAGLGTRLGLWQFRTGFTILRVSGYAGLGAGAICLGLTLLAAVRGSRPSLPIAVLGVAFGFAASYLPWHWMRKAASVPRIHDISTDTDDPPRFVALLPVRQASSNGAAYGGPEVAAQQKAAYPDIIPVDLPLPPPEALRKAESAARALHWNIAAVDAAEGRLEATATTFWFGFKDDVAVRVRPAKSGSRLDVRSMSRVGKSDIGTNAERIREFVRRLHG